ncbi:MAG: hypothetical protein H6551_05940 [Chitinophagales bacterium]|nr:hypothetical protein [Chitinophagaceae bacterium]MCB9064673.1 hypothetical protein [Chitinophagales bacterium]
MHNRIEMKRNIYKDFLVVLLIAVISITVVVAVWMHYVEDIDQIEQRISEPNIQSNNN